jgi:hypothetical protein
MLSVLYSGSLPIHERKPKHASPDLPPPHTASNFVDGQQCFTDYEPRYGAKVNDTSMHRIVVSGNLDSRLLMEPDTDATGKPIVARSFKEITHLSRFLQSLIGGVVFGSISRSQSCLSTRLVWDILT